MTHPDLAGNGKWCEAFTHELQAAVDALTGKKPAGPLSGETALSALKMCWAEAKSIETSAAVPV
ncbi:MAG: hypothetical protein JNJ47_08905 [Alphaproteobacteria bacterium]|nr:hypothetical protein [Alphaproteobacteria bacterium]